MIEERRHPACGRVAIVTRIAAVHVGRCLSLCRNIVVASAASAGNLRVVHGVYRRPRVAVVTILANVGCQHMRRRFAGRLDAVVATAAIVDDTDMVKVRGTPGIGGVAVVTSIAAIDMGRMLTRCDHAVVTGIAGSHHLRVIYRIYRHPYIGVVAVLADVAGLDVGRVLALRLCTVMAAEAVSDNIYMVEVSRNPASRCVTIIAGVTAGYVRRILAGGSHAIVA